MINYRELESSDERYFKRGIQVIKDSHAWPGVHDDQIKWFTAAKECCVFGAFKDDKLIAVALGGILPENQYDFYSVFHSELKNSFQKNTTGVLLASAVDKSYRRKGIGTKLLDLRIKWLKDQGATQFIANSWGNKLKESSPSLFKQAGFKVLSYYCSYDSSDLFCFLCQGRCHCENFFFIKNLDLT